MLWASIPRCEVFSQKRPAAYVYSVIVRPLMLNRILHPRLRILNMRDNIYKGRYIPRGLQIPVSDDMER